MTCREMEGVIITSGHESEVAEHIAECERCRRLVWTFGENRQFSPPSSEQMKRIEAVMLGNLTRCNRWRPLAHYSPPLRCLYSILRCNH